MDSSNESKKDHIWVVKGCEAELYDQNDTESIREGEMLKVSQSFCFGDTMFENKKKQEVYGREKRTYTFCWHGDNDQEIRELTGAQVRRQSWSWEAAVSIPTGGMGELELPKRQGVDRGEDGCYQDS